MFRTFALLISLGTCAQGLPVDHIDGHCDLRVGIEPRGYCQEWRSLLDAPGSDTSIRGVCAALGTQYVDTVCPDTDDIIGGCYLGELGDGSESYWWYYAIDGDGEPQTEVQVRAECEGDGDFVAWFASDT